MCWIGVVTKTLSHGQPSWKPSTNFIIDVKIHDLTILYQLPVFNPQGGAGPLEVPEPQKPIMLNFQ